MTSALIPAAILAALILFGCFVALWLEARHAPLDETMTSSGDEERVDYRDMAPTYLVVSDDERAAAALVVRA